MNTENQNPFVEMSTQELLNVGINHIAYIRPLDGQENGYAIHSADGKQITVLDSYPEAAAEIREHNLHPVTVH